MGKERKKEKKKRLHGEFQIHKFNKIHQMKVFLNFALVRASGGTGFVYIPLSLAL